MRGYTGLMERQVWNKRPDMIVHEASPFNAEPARRALVAGDLTEIAAFYRRNHGPIPDIAAPDWRLAVDGLVDDPLSLTFAELSTRFGGHAEVATLQCAGNRRAGFNQVRPIDGEDPWGPAAISTADWFGARLAEVLTAAGVSGGAVEPEGIRQHLVGPPASPSRPHPTYVTVSVSPVTITLFAANASVAGPCTTEPSVMVNLLPWQGQLMVPPLTLSTTQP